jgi:hypothetical protein
MWGPTQGVLVGGGALLVLGLLHGSTLARHLLWNLLVPVAPALLALAPGVWRNVCPLGTLASLGGRLDLGLARKPSVSTLHGLQLAGVVLLVLLVPLRHLLLDASGPASALVLLGLGGLALAAGGAGPGKSTWCASLCPVHPVERLYGVGATVAPVDARCADCTRCHAGCVDLTPRATPLTSRRTHAGRVAGWWLVGGFPGFVWGWFQVSDAIGPLDAGTVAHAYAVPLGAGLVSLAIFGVLRRGLGAASEPGLVRLGAALSLGTYYGYRLPALVGMGVFPGQGMLVDLSGVLPAGVPQVMPVMTLGLAGLWYLRGQRPLAWTRRPVLEPVPAMVV